MTSCRVSGKWSSSRGLDDCRAIVTAPVLCVPLPLSSPAAVSLTVALSGLCAAMDLAAERREREKALAKAHAEYLEENPAVKKMLADFISSALVEQPVDVFEFARNHFKGTATAVEEDAEGDDDDLGGVTADQDDLDDLDDMAAGGNSELTAYLKEVFDSIDTDGSGSISQAELKKKLAVRDATSTLAAPVLYFFSLARLSQMSHLAHASRTCPNVGLRRVTTSCRPCWRLPATDPFTCLSNSTSTATARSPGWIREHVGDR